MAKTIDDIAKLAGVSSTTVSRVINTSGYVKDETREKILKIIKDMNYTPSAVARNLSKQSTNTIGVIVPDITNTYFGEIIKGVTNIAENHNINIVLFNTDNDKEKEIKSLKIAMEQRLEGVIMTPTFGAYQCSKELEEVIRGCNIPVVLVSADLKDLNLNGVFVDDFTGGFEATNLLLNEGHKEIIIITGLLNSEPAYNRLRGYKEALLNKNINIKDEYILEGDFDFDKAYKLTKTILSKKDKPTAIVSCSNMMTLGVIKALLEEKINIPYDIAVVGFNKLEILEFMSIELTYVEDSPLNLGSTAVEILLDILKDKMDKSNRIIVPPKLIIKGSEKFIERLSY